MEKYGVGSSDLILSLRDEEARLMQEVSALMSQKTASFGQQLPEVEARLTLVRQKITEYDLRK